VGIKVKGECVPHTSPPVHCQTLRFLLDSLPFSTPH